MARPDHYATLEVGSAATQREIRAAYRRLARETHPDGHAGDERLERRFKRIARAYEVLGDAGRRKAYDERLTTGRFAAPGSSGRATFAVDAGPIYHSDLGHHSDFYQAGDPLSVQEAAALVGRAPTWLRRCIRQGRLRATRDATGYLLRRRDVERLDRMSPRRARSTPDQPPDDPAGGDPGPPAADRLDSSADALSRPGRRERRPRPR